MSVNLRYLNRSWLSFASSCYTVEKSVLGVEEVKIRSISSPRCDRKRQSGKLSDSIRLFVVHLSSFMSLLAFLFWDVFLEQSLPWAEEAKRLISLGFNHWDSKQWQRDARTRILTLHSIKSACLLVRINLLLAFVYPAAWLWNYTKHSVSHQTTQASRSVLFNWSQGHNFN